MLVTFFFRINSTERSNTCKMAKEVQCVKCKAVFKNDCKSATEHAKAVHNGKQFGIEAVELSIQPGKKIKIEHFDLTENHVDSGSFSIPDVEINSDDPLETTTKSEEIVEFGNLWNNIDSHNKASEGEAISWSSLIGNLGDLVRKLQECKEVYDNSRSSEDVNQKLGATNIVNAAISVKEASSYLIEVGNQFLQQPFDSNNRANLCIYDPALRPPNLTNSQKQYLINMGPHQPRLAKFPSDGKNRFSAKWYDEFEHLEYSLEKDAAFCFTCSLFPKGKGKDPWVSVGVKSWSKMKSRGRDKPGKLQQHFFGESHKQSVRDYYLSFSSSTEVLSSL